MSDEDFIADDCRTGVSKDGQYVRITFGQDSGETRVILLSKDWVPSLIEQLQRRIGPNRGEEH